MVLAGVAVGAVSSGVVGVLVVGVGFVYLGAEGIGEVGIDESTTGIGGGEGIAMDVLEGVGFLVVAGGLWTDGDHDATRQGEVLFKDIPVVIAEVVGSVSTAGVAGVGVALGDPVPVGYLVIVSTDYSALDITVVVGSRTSTGGVVLFGVGVAITAVVGKA